MFGHRSSGCIAAPVLLPTSNSRCCTGFVGPTVIPCDACVVDALAMTSGIPIRVHRRVHVHDAVVALIGTSLATFGQCATLVHDGARFSSSLGPLYPGKYTTMTGKSCLRLRVRVCDGSYPFSYTMSMMIPLAPLQSPNSGTMFTVSMTIMLMS